VTVLSDHPQISPPRCWDNHKMRAKKNIVHCGQLAEDVRYLRPLLRIKTVRLTSLISIKSDQSASRTYNHRGSAEPRQLSGVLRWCNLS